LSTGGNQGAQSSGGQIELEGPKLTATVPSKVKTVLLTEQEFHLLMEGAGRPDAASTRDLCLGFCVAALISAFSTWATAPTPRFTDVTATGTAPAWGPLLLCLAMAAMTLATGAVALVCHRRMKGDGGRRSFRGLVSGLCQQLSIENVYSASGPDATIKTPL
jgi:hypothetical protein